MTKLKRHNEDLCDFPSERDAIFVSSLGGRGLCIWSSRLYLARVTLYTACYQSSEARPCRSRVMRKGLSYIRVADQASSSRASSVSRKLLGRVEGTIRRGVEDQLGRGGRGVHGVDEPLEEWGEVFGASDPNRFMTAYFQARPH